MPAWYLHSAAWPLMCQESKLFCITLCYIYRAKQRHIHKQVMLAILLTIVMVIITQLQAFQNSESKIWALAHWTFHLLVRFNMIIGWDLWNLFSFIIWIRLTSLIFFIHKAKINPDGRKQSASVTTSSISIHLFWNQLETKK